MRYFNNFAVFQIRLQDCGMLMPQIFHAHGQIKLTWEIKSFSFSSNFFTDGWEGIETLVFAYLKPRMTYFTIFRKYKLPQIIINYCILREVSFANATSWKTIYLSELVIKRNFWMSFQNWSPNKAFVIYIVWKEKYCSIAGKIT